MIDLNALTFKAHRTAIRRGKNPENACKDLASEVAELQEALALYRATQDGGCFETTDTELVTAIHREVQNEFADVVINALTIARLYGIDAEKAIIEKMRYNATRHD